MKGKAAAVSKNDEDGENKKKEETKEKKKFKDYFWLDPKGRFLSTFDTFMLIIVAYSCFASAYFTAFDFPKDSPLLWNLEHVVFVSFTLDIIFTFIRIPDSDGDEK